MVLVHTTSAPLKKDKAVANTKNSTIVVLADDTTYILNTLVRLVKRSPVFTQDRFEIISCESPKLAIEAMNKHCEHVALIVTDFDFGCGQDGLDILTAAHNLSPQAKCVLHTGGVSQHNATAVERFRQAKSLADNTIIKGDKDGLAALRAVINLALTDKAESDKTAG